MAEKSVAASKAIRAKEFLEKGIVPVLTQVHSKQQL